MEFGFDPEGFWRITPKELKVRLDGAVRRLMREHNDRAWTVWHIEALRRSKKLPKLKTLQSREKPRRKSWQEMLAIAKAFDRAVNAKLRRG